MASVRASAVGGIPEVRAGDDLGALIACAAAAQLRDGVVLVVAHKVVSKAEGAVVSLAEIAPGRRARELAAQADKDPRAVQVVLDESAEVLRAERGVIICRTRQGFVCANAGVDASNVEDPDTVVVLPRDPDGSARALRARVRELTGARVAVLVSDSFGRAWRHGQVDVAIGLAGMRALDDWRGRADSAGMRLQATWLAVADAAAALADLARAKDSREPVVVVEGLERYVTAQDGPGAAELLRPRSEDLFA
ncbi:MAG TPA: coenzyme F420-0:L-glutamate ligase [Solirubrobacteraceae bacterium]|nr:coenzyme F420-0:L-glutamate ligase [Solirubrobacteraceae bacterium]